VKTTIDAQLLREARRFALRFACEDCAHFDPDHERCSLLFDPAPRRSALESDCESLHAPPRRDAPPRAAGDGTNLSSSGAAGGRGRDDDARVVELCKAFELA
jgi:hypothetical protein